MSSQKNKVRRHCAVNVGRWASYAAAGAVTAMMATNDAEASILYSGPINTVLGPGTAKGFIKTIVSTSNIGTVKLGTVYHRHAGYPPPLPGMKQQTGYFAQFFMLAAKNGQARGTLAGTAKYASKLPLSANISGGGFIAGNGVGPPFGGDAMAQFQGRTSFGAGTVVVNRKWSTPGTGFLGFSFNLGAGVQYGWARVTMAPTQVGPPALNAKMHVMDLVDYAYGTPGQAILAGQEVAAAPEPATLGLLAIGAAGLMAIRGLKKRRALTP